MQNLISTQPYRFVPPRANVFWWRIIVWLMQRQLRKSDGVTSWEFRGLDRLRASGVDLPILFFPGECTNDMVELAIDTLTQE